MRPRDKRLLTVIVILAAIGLLHMVYANPSGMLIPVLVLGTVFLLYKYPPRRWRRRGPRRHGPRGPSSGTKGRTGHRNKTKLRVIRGNKKDDPPRYH